MKFIWEAEDVRMGRMVHRIRSSKNINPEDIFVTSYGWDYPITATSGKFICLISMADGMQMCRHDEKDKEGLAKSLTEGGFMPISYGDWKKVIDFIGETASNF
jgi:hypothetical protein